jgi:hypothetical protein
MGGKRRFTFIFLSIIIIAISSCATFNKNYGQKRSSNVCPESEHIKCLAHVVCDYDVERDCEVCICSDDMETINPELAGGGTR